MLAAILELEPCGSQRFIARHHQQNFRHSLFGGQVLAQALMAAGLTVDEHRHVHSLHAYFLRAGNTSSVVELEVETLRDGKHVSTRLVKVHQNQKQIFTLMASFHSPETGFHHQPSLCPEVASMRPDATLTAPRPDWPTAEYLGDAPLDYLPSSDSLINPSPQNESEAHCWMRAREQLGSPLRNYCALAFASDMALLASALLPHDTTLFSPSIFPASMDHSIWFHRPVDFSQWHHYLTHSPWAGSGRGLCSGAFYDVAGTLIASVSQEGLIRRTG